MSLSDYKIIMPIKKGWSADEKYCVENKDGKKYFLRISTIEQYNDKKAEFEMMKRLDDKKVPLCRPIKFFNDEEKVYSLHSWINGVDLNEIINDFAQEQQYELGIECGRILKIIHSIPAPKKIISWDKRFNKKIDRNINNYLNCSIKLDGDNRIITFINENRFLLNKRPQTYQHGDYHIGNIMYENNNIVIIDFNRNDYGDPWEEFNRISWCVDKSIFFASGMIDGYFDNNPTLKFWKLLALYQGSNVLSSIPWAIPFGEKEVDVMLFQAEKFLLSIDGFNSIIPKWYVGKSN